METLLVDSMFAVLCSILAATAWMMISLARRLGRPMPSLRDMRVNRQGWLRRWVSLVFVFVFIKSIMGLGRLWEGIPPWPRWPQDLLLCLPIAAVIALFIQTSPEPETDHESSTDDTNSR